MSEWYDPYRTPKECWLAAMSLLYDTDESKPIVEYWYEDEYEYWPKTPPKYYRPKYKKVAEWVQTDNYAEACTYMKLRPIRRKEGE